MVTTTLLTRTLRALGGALLGLLLASCGGGGGDAPATPAPAPGVTTTAPLAAPAITTQPANQTITENSNAAFNVVASGSGLNYQWQNSTDAGATWADVSGATSASLNLNAVPLARHGERVRVRVSNGGGQVLSAEALLSVNAAGAPRAWQTAQRLRAADGLSNGTAGPAVAGNASGAFIAAWVDVDLTTGDSALLTRRYSPGAGWGTTDLVASWTNADDPTFHGFSIGLAPSGTAAIVFIGRANLRDSLYGSHQVAGGAWAAPTLLEDDDIGSTFSRMALVMDDNGVATAVWGQDFGTFPAVFTTRRALAARMAPDGSWSPYVDIDFPAVSGINGVTLTPRLAVNANGDVAAGWTASIPSGPNGGQYAAAAVYTQAGGWGIPVLLTPGVGGNNSVLEDITIAANGSAAASLHLFPYTTPGATRSVLLARYAPGSGWANAVEVDQTTAESLFSRVALGDDGTAVVIWQQASFGGNLLYTNTVSAGGSVGTPLMLSANTGSIVNGQTLRRDPAGNVMVLWGTYEPSYRLVSRVRDAAGNWGAQGSVWTLASNIGFDADAMLAVAPDGTAAAAWHVNDGTGNSVPWINLYR